MTTFDIITPDMGTPWYVPFLIAVGLLLFAVLSFTASFQFDSKVKRDGVGSSLFMMLGMVTLLIALFAPAAVFNAKDSSVRDELIISALEDRGFDNIDLNLTDNTFTGSDKDGLFVRGDVLEKSYTEYVVVVRND